MLVRSPLAISLAPIESRWQHPRFIDDWGQEPCRERQANNPNSYSLSGATKKVTGRWFTWHVAVDGLPRSGLRWAPGPDAFAGAACCFLNVQKTWRVFCRSRSRCRCRCGRGLGGCCRSSRVLGSWCRGSWVVCPLWRRGSVGGVRRPARALFWCWLRGASNFAARSVYLGVPWCLLPGVVSSRVFRALYCRRCFLGNGRVFSGCPEFLSVFVPVRLLTAAVLCSRCWWCRAGRSGRSSWSVSMWRGSRRACLPPALMVDVAPIHFRACVFVPCLVLRALCRVPLKGVGYRQRSLPAVLFAACF